MNAVIIRRSGREGADSKMFRACDEGGKSLKVSCSTTGNESYAIVRCAAKAFIKLAGSGELEEVETRVKTVNIGSGMWEATLQS